MGKISIATTIISTNESAIREMLTLRTAEEAKRLHIPIVAVYKGTRSPFIDELENLGVLLSAETKSGMGAGRRQALKEAASIAGEEGAIVWMEPEKNSFVPYITKLSESIFHGEADIVIPMRENLYSYPKDQQKEEELLNLVCAHVLKREKADLSFGPRIMNKKALSFFLDYEGEYGDKWDSIFIPILRIIKAGLSVHYVDVPYVHPIEQTREEEGSPDMFKKRVEQFCNLAPIFYAEAERLERI